jgi:hypothetical protein
LIEDGAPTDELIDTCLAGPSRESAGFEGVEVALERGFDPLRLAVELDEFGFATWPVGVELGMCLGNRLMDERLVVEDMLEFIEQEVLELLRAECPESSFLDTFCLE